MGLQTDAGWNVLKLWLRLSLRQKLGIAFTVMTVIPMVLATAILWQPYQQAMLDLVFERNRNQAEQIANDVDRMFVEKIRLLKIIAHSGDMRSMDERRQAPLLRDIVTHNSEVQLAVVGDAAAQQVARWDGLAADDAINYRDRPYFHQVMATETTAISGVTRAKSTGRLGIVMAEPIRSDAGSITGVLIINIELQKLLNRIAETKIGREGYAYIVDRNGALIIDRELGVTESTVDISRQKPVQAAISGQTGWLEYELTNRRWVAGYSFAPTSQWGIIVQLPLDEALEPVNHIRLLSILVVIGFALCAALIGLGIAGALSRPLAEVAVAVNRLAAGEHHIGLNVNGSDEIGQLSAAFNNMAVQLQRRAAELQQSEQKYRSLLENISVGVYRYRMLPQEGFMQVNPAMAAIFGYESMAELQTVLFIDLYENPLDREAALAEIRKNGNIKNREVVLRKKDRTPIWCSFSVTAQYDEQGRIDWLDGVVEEVTERKWAEEEIRQSRDKLESQVEQRTRQLLLLNEELRRLSLLDGLTGLANRRYFDDFFQREWQRARREGSKLAVIMLDIDCFKNYNDAYGHLAGDECLKRVAGVLRDTVKRGTDLVARYGGEEFVVVLPNTEAPGAWEVGENIRLALERQAIEHRTSPVSDHVTVSVGVACHTPVANDDPVQLIAAADQALYLAKSQGRNRTRLADPAFSAGH